MIDSHGNDLLAAEVSIRFFLYILQIYITDDPTLA